MAKVSVVAGDPHERQRQWAARAHPILSPEQGSWGHQDSPSPGVGTSLGLGMSHGPTGGLGLVGPRAAVETGDQPCCGISGAGADGPRGLPWSPGPLALAGCGDALQACY